LDRAAFLENRDLRQAIAVYRLIELSHPGTPAAEEANRNIRAIRAAHPELESP
jgi:hypothetical protein